eukprot:m.8242 g.8242  ORF g.8242 m.8242 type:complete len:116 (-) comp2267_c0_seq1:188-535(-)
MCTIQDFLAGQRSLVCFLQGMAGVCTTIELRNETTVHGTIETVDALMGMTITDAVLRTLHGEEQHFESFYVIGKHVRYVHVPDDIHVEQTIRNRLRTTADGMSAYRRKPKRGRLP